MKIPLILLALFLTTIALVVAFGDRIITAEFTAGKYTHRLPKSDGAITESTVLDGLGAALELNGMADAGWVFAPSTSWDPPDALARSTKESPEPFFVIVSLTNKSNGKRLYAEVKAQKGDGSLHYRLLYPK